MSGVVKGPLGEVAHKIGKADVLAIRDDLVERGRVGDEVRQGVRTETFALLDLACPPPLPDDVTDEHRVRADVERVKDPHYTTAHHWLQKRHQQALWAEADRLVAEAGVT